MTPASLTLGPYDALLFDMDGTILTSVAAIERSWSAWAARVGVDAAEILAYMHGRPAEDIVRHFMPPGRDLAEEVDWLGALELADLEGVAPIAGVARFLHGLPPGQWAVVTSATRRLAQRRIAAAGLPQPDVLVSSDDVTQGKPHPEGYVRAAAALGYAADRCLVLEDARSGIRAGLAAGAGVIHLAGTEESGDLAVVARIPDYVTAQLRCDAEGLYVTLDPEVAGS
ncbi:HAD-IA family hydrolase [Rhodobacter sp. NSM]|uniref:HAD-IA family hydrolase n=1 Tax=Rhodobacter sp. NSM TaxID=3457501 RepID=UPI003FD07CCE